MGKKDDKMIKEQEKQRLAMRVSMVSIVVNLLLSVGKLLVS